MDSVVAPPRVYISVNKADKTSGRINRCIDMMAVMMLIIGNGLHLPRAVGPQSLGSVL